MLANIAILLAVGSEKTKKRKKMPMKEWFKKRSKFSHDCLLNELVVSPPEDYKNFLRTNHDTSATLSTMVKAPSP